MSRRGLERCRDAMCGSPACITCFGASAERYRQEMAHEYHEDPECPIAECEECDADAHAAEMAAEAKYDQRREEGWEV